MSNSKTIKFSEDELLSSSEFKENLLQNVNFDQAKNINTKFKKKKNAFKTEDCFMELEIKNAEIQQLRLENQNLFESISQMSQLKIEIIEYQQQLQEEKNKNEHLNILLSSQEVSNDRSFYTATVTSCNNDCQSQIQEYELDIKKLRSAYDDLLKEFNQKDNKTKTNQKDLNKIKNLNKGQNQTYMLNNFQVFSNKAYSITENEFTDYLLENQDLIKGDINFVYETAEKIFQLCQMYRNQNQNMFYQKIKSIIKILSEAEYQQDCGQQYINEEIEKLWFLVNDKQAKDFMTFSMEKSCTNEQKLKYIRQLLEEKINIETQDTLEKHQQNDLQYINQTINQIDLDLQQLDGSNLFSQEGSKFKIINKIKGETQINLQQNSDMQLDFKKTKNIQLESQINNIYQEKFQQLYQIYQNYPHKKFSDLKDSFFNVQTKHSNLCSLFKIEKVFDTTSEQQRIEQDSEELDYQYSVEDEQEMQFSETLTIRNYGNANSQNQSNTTLNQSSEKNNSSQINIDQLKKIEDIHFQYENQVRQLQNKIQELNQVIQMQQQLKEENIKEKQELEQTLEQQSKNQQPKILIIDNLNKKLLQRKKTMPIIIHCQSIQGTPQKQNTKGDQKQRIQILEEENTKANQQIFLLQKQNDNLFQQIELLKKEMQDQQIYSSNIESQMSLIQCSQDEFGDDFDKEIEILNQQKNQIQESYDSLQEKYNNLEKSNQNLLCKQVLLQKQTFNLKNIIIILKNQIQIENESIFYKIQQIKEFQDIFKIKLKQHQKKQNFQSLNFKQQEQLNNHSDEIIQLTLNIQNKENYIEQQQQDIQYYQTQYQQILTQLKTKQSMNDMQQSQIDQKTLKLSYCLKQIFALKIEIQRLNNKFAKIVNQFLSYQQSFFNGNRKQRKGNQKVD